MIEWYDYFQIATLILFFLLTLGRAIHLRMTQHINPITIGTGKKRLHQAVEICLSLALALWAVVVLSFAFHVEETRFLPFENWQLLDWQFVKLIGAGLLTSSLIIFILALISFGNSWRVGIDEKTPGELVQEEKFLQGRYGEAYEEYRARTGRYIRFRRLSRA